MFKIVLLGLVASLGLAPLSGPPDLIGLSTYYGLPAFMDGDTMANGYPLDLDAPTVAVDVSHQGWLNRRALVLTECGALHKATVTDTGRLYAIGGWLRRGVRQGQSRYWPVLEGMGVKGSEPVLLTSVSDRGIQWTGNRAYRVVADFPERFYAERVACHVDAWGKGETQLAWLWLVK